MKLLKLIPLGLLLITIKVWAVPDFRVLSFHDVVPKLTATSDIDDVTTDNLINYFSWLKENGFQVISIQDVIDYKNGQKKLPEKSVVLTFDDGYKSFYTYVLPLLKAFNYPATLAIVGSWLEVPEGGQVLYGEKLESRSKFLSLSELREISNSKLVEIASHTYSLHRAVIGNPQGNLMPALSTYEYDTKSQKYETTEHYINRIQRDLEKNNAWLKKILGKSPRVIVWPYGSYNGLAQGIAKKLGLEVAITLDDGENLEFQSLDSISRIYLINNPTIPQFADNFRNLIPKVERVMHVDLDYIYDQNITQQEKNLDALLERVKKAGVTTVYLQAFSDDDATGVAKSVYFHNHYLPVKADLFNRVSWQLQSRLDVKVYAWMPLLAFSPNTDQSKSLDFVQSADGSKGVGYLRLSPFSVRSRNFIAGIYEDLAKYSNFNGILIHDDATLSDSEDASPPALRFYSEQWGLPANINEIKSDPTYNHKWIKAKTEYLSSFAIQLKEVASKYQKPLGLARNYYAEVALNPASEEWFAQSIPNGIDNFDWVALMAMPYMEKASNPTKWLNELVTKTDAYPGAKQKVIYELQAKNWDTMQAIPSKELSGWMRMLRAKGALHFGYYPDDPFTNQPNIDIIKQELSTEAEVKP
jgi:biofilm PGA synthesis lipoprotein PgaB